MHGNDGPIHGFEHPELDAGGGLVALRVGEVGVDEPIAMVGSSAEPAAGGAVGEHGVAGPDLQAAPLGFGEPAEEAHQHLVACAVGVDPTAELGHPQLDPVVSELREHELELSAREGPLRLGDDQRRSSPGRVRGVGQDP